MSCGNRNYGYALSTNRSNGYRAANCGFEASWSYVKPKCNYPTVLTERVITEFPTTCPAPEYINVVRATTIAGIDSACFLTGDCKDYREDRFYNIVASDDIISLQSFHMPAYLLLKNGNLHAASMSVGDIENHPISAFLRGNNHIFGGRVSELYELAPEDYNVEANNGDNNCIPKRKPLINVIDPASLNHQYLSIEVNWVDCTHTLAPLVEYFYIVPLECANGMKCKGANLANWFDDQRTCGETILIPAKALDTGALQIPDRPVKKCGGGYGYNGYANRAIPFNGFG